MTKQDLKEMISDIIKSEFKRYIPVLIKEIRSGSKNLLISESNKPPKLKTEHNLTPITENISDLNWLKSFVDPDAMSKQLGAETSSPSVLDESVDSLPKSVTSAFTKDYSGLVQAMSKKPVR